MRKNKLVIALLALMFLGCSSTPEKKGADISDRMSERTYSSLLEKYTRADIKYEGFYNKYEVHVTFMNNEVQTALLQKRSDAQAWDARTAQTERERMFQENATQTKFFLSLFVPSARLNDLNKASSIWKLYLELGGQRYEGKVSRRNGKLEDTKALFPTFNRWSVPYEVVFTVPLSAAEQGHPVFVITSTQGTSKLQF